MGLDFEYINGQTPLDEEERVGLLIETIATRTELDEFEQQNIEDAIQWTLGRSFKSETILTESFIRGLHWRMYKNVWSWAGEFRRTDKNIGIDKWQIATALKALCDDAAFWIKNETYSPDETAIRFKHRLVSIHCFPNGNGRHSRLMTDVIIDKIYKQPVFTWGAGDLAGLSDTRKEYLLALKEADKGQLNELLRFARS
ncbi:MAG: mobile mystery protein B [Imperialibacter sp.]